MLAYTTTSKRSIIFVELKRSMIDGLILNLHLDNDLAFQRGL